MEEHELLMVLNKMALNEETIGQLYTMYAARFFSHKDMWEEMAAQELGHAALLRNCLQEIAARHPPLPSSFPEEAVETFTDYVQREIQILRETEVTIGQALKTALYIEQGLLESRYLEPAAPDICQAANTFEQLRKETDEHARRLKEALLALKGQPV
jgi:rubrerythrin